MKPAGAVTASVLFLVACGDPTLTARRQGFRLVEKGAYQSLYRSDGTIERVVHDPNGDGKADAIVLYAPTGTIRQAELDTDRDGTIDRWEYFESGTLVRVGSSRAKPGVPDYWERLGPDGTTVTHREYDDDGDGMIDRSVP